MNPRSLPVLLVLFLASHASAAERMENAGWRFLRVEGEPPDAAQVVKSGYDDAAWAGVTLPHTVRVEAPEKCFAPFLGTAWYRHTVTALPEWKGKRVSLFFEGAMQVAEVWVNGELRTHHEGGYLPFSVDLTDDLTKDGKAVLAVKLDNTHQPQIPPGKPNKGVDFCYFGGLYRNVRLRVTDPVHLTDAVEADKVAGGGTFVRYENVSEKSADVMVSANLRNDGTAGASVTVLFSLLDPGQKEVTSATFHHVTKEAGTDQNFQAKLKVPDPSLWSPDSPALYTLVTKVLRDQQVVDEKRERIGIRSVSFGNDGFMLNGKPLVLRGANRHQDYPWLGNAVPDNASYRDIRLLKEAGYNFLRLAHYPQSQAIMEACDELGVMVSVCTPGWQNFNNDEHFKTLARRNVREMIRWHRNHPSVAMWEVTLNETYGHDDFYAECAKIAHEEYPGDQMLTSGDTYASKAAGYLDIPYPVWTDDHNVANPTAKWTKAFAREYGDYNFGGQHSTSRVPRGAGEDRLLLQAWNHVWNHNFNIASPWFGGDCLWAGIDDASGFGTKEMPVSWWGPLDYSRIPKFSYYFFQSLRDPAVKRADVGSGPMAYIANYWIPRESPGKVVVFSNCDEVELFVNGRSLGRRKPDSGPDSKYGEWRPDADVVYMANGANISADEAKTAAQVASHKDKKPTAMFDGGNCQHLEHAPFTFPGVKYEAGELKAVAYRNGQPVVTDFRCTPGKAAALKLEIAENGKPLAADGSDAVFVRALVVDANGTLVPDAAPVVNFQFEGEARAVTPGDLKAEAGIASALIASSGKTGKIRISAKSEGLASAALEYAVK